MWQRGGDSGNVYIIDTTQLGEGEGAYDMEKIMEENDYGDPRGVGGEVNLTSIPKRAIVGCIHLTGVQALLDSGSVAERVVTHLDNYTITFNRAYAGAER